MSPSYAWLRPATSLLVACLLASACTAANAKLSTRRRAGPDIPTDGGTIPHIGPPTDLNADVHCDNQIALTWQYDETKYNIEGFVISVCKNDVSPCTVNMTSGNSRNFTYQVFEHNTTYASYVAAYGEDASGSKVYSDAARAVVTSYPKIPGLEDLTITASSPRALKAQWGTSWSDNIEFSICHGKESCRNQTVAGEKLEHTFTDLLPKTVYTVSAQAEATLEERTCKGEIQKRTSTTLPLQAPTNIMVTLSCKGDVKTAWQYKAPDDIDGFVTRLCYKNGSMCRSKTLPASSRDDVYTVTESSTVFNISVQAYVDGGYTSGKDQLTFTSLPQLPDLNDLVVRGVSPTEVEATWNEKWDHDIEFIICRTPTECKTDIVPGVRLSYIFTGLEPDTQYTVSAQAEISVQNETCKGHKQELDATTFQVDPPMDLTVSVLCTNEARITWKYNETTRLTGFVASLCHKVNEQNRCKNQTIKRSERNCTFVLPLSNAPYNVTVWAYYQDHESSFFSQPAESNFTSYPKLPELTSITVAGVSSTELVAKWQEKWTGDIYFTVCSSQTGCRNETAEGTYHNHTFDGLLQNTTYVVSTKTGATLNNKTCFGPVLECTASTFVPTPLIVRNLTGKIVNGTLLEASWDAPEHQKNVTGYTIQCNDAKTHYNQSEDIVGGDESNHVSLALHELTATFNCSVRAFNKDTMGLPVYGPPDGFEVTTDGIGAPKNVTLLAYTATSFTFMWSADPNATKCEVEVHREDDYGESLPSIEACGESVNGTVMHNVTGLDPWTTYNVSIKNCRDTFCGEPFFAVSNTGVAAPSEVRNFSYAIEKEVSVHFTWKAPEYPNGPLDGYRLQIFDEDAQQVKQINFTAKETDTTLDLKFQFHLFNVSIAAFNYDNNTRAALYGNESEVKFETLGKGPMPPRPKAEDVKENSVNLFWEEPEDPRYNITLFEVKVSGQTPITTTVGNVTIEHLSTWTNYEVNVSSCTNKSNCGQDRHFHFRTDFGAPSAPEDFKAPSAGTHWMLVQWEKPKVLNGPLSGYNLTFSHGSSQSHTIVTELSYNATDLVPGTNYEVAVFAFNEVQSIVKHGPAVTLQASTQADTPSHAGASTATIVLAVLIPLIFLLAVAAFFLYKKYKTTTGERTPLTTAEDS